MILTKLIASDVLTWNFVFSHGDLLTEKVLAEINSGYDHEKNNTAYVGHRRFACFNAWTC